MTATRGHDMEDQKRVTYSTIQIKNLVAHVNGHTSARDKPTSQARTQRGQVRPKSAGKQEKLEEMNTEENVPKPRVDGVGCLVIK
jgi:hypothetical protein